MNPEGMQVFDGVMLSDAGLSRFSLSYRDSLNRPVKGKDSYFYISQSKGALHFDWLQHIKLALQSIGLPFTNTSPCVRRSVSHGRPYEYCALWSRVCSIATDQRKRWYPNDIKEVPEDLVLTPVVLANWFMGDGGSTLGQYLERGYIENRIAVSLSPASFSEESIDSLVLQLGNLGFSHFRRSTDRRVEKGSGINLVCNMISEVNYFVDLVEPYLLPSFAYKCKHLAYKYKTYQLRRKAVKL